jgi:hypothetical protein
MWKDSAFLKILPFVFDAQVGFGAPSALLLCTKRTSWCKLFSLVLAQPASLVHISYFSSSLQLLPEVQLAAFFSLISL